MKKVMSVFILTTLIISSIGGIGASVNIKENTIEDKTLNIIENNPEQQTNHKSPDGPRKSYINLLVVPDSVMILKEYWFFPFTNRIEFTVKNEGTENVYNLRVDITIEYWDNLNKTPMRTDYSAKIVYLPPGGSETNNRPLFRTSGEEIIETIIKYAGILNINITVDPDKKYPEDLNRLDNTVKFPTEYKDIFPKLAFLEFFILKYF